MTDFAAVFNSSVTSTARPTGREMKDFFEACGNGDFKALSAFVTKFGARHVHSEDTRGQTPLMFAAMYGQDEAVSFLSRLGADLDRKSEYGWTVLTCANFYGQKSTTELLKELGATPSGSLRKNAGGVAGPCKIA